MRYSGNNTLFRLVEGWRSSHQATVTMANLEVDDQPHEHDTPEEYTHSKAIQMR